MSALNRPASPLSQITHLALPMLVGQIAVMLNGTADTIMAGQISPLDLATVGIGASIYAAIFVSVMGVLLALAPIIAHHHGAGRISDIGEEVRQGAWLSIMLAAITITILTHPGPLLALSKLTPEMEVRVRAYLSALAWAAPAGFAFRLFYGFSAGIARPRPIMVFNLLGLALKVFFNWVFMFGHLGSPAFGALGCGISSILSAWLVATLAWYWCAIEPGYRSFGIFTRWSWPDRARLFALLRLGMPMGATFVFDVTAFTFMALFVARLGPTASGAHQIAANLSALTFMVPMAVANALAVLSGQSLGRGDPIAARHVGITGFKLGIGVACAFGLVLWMGRHTIAGFYTVDADVHALAASVIALVAFYHLVDALQAIAVNLLRGYKKAMVPMLIYAVALWGIGLPGGVVLGLHGIAAFDLAPLGVHGFWIAAIAGLGMAGLGVTGYWWKVAQSQTQRFT